MIQVGYLPGPRVCGFYGQFEADFGRPGPVPKVIPSAISGVLLPFHCPHCGKVRAEFSCPILRLLYKDPRPGKDSFHCPSCRGRFYLCEEGAPLEKPLPKGAKVAPSTIEWPKGKEPASVLGVLAARGASGLDVLGAGVLKYQGR